MDETIDLRPYVDMLVRRWRVILGAVVAGILIAVVLHFSSLNYRATALVAALDPSQRLQFDERITNTINLSVYAATYPEIANSDGVLSVVLAKARELSGGAVATMPDLRKKLEVKAGLDSRLLRLSVRDRDSQVAAELANVWATAFVKAVDEIYFGQSGQITFYENLQSDNNAQLQNIEQALVDFQSGNRAGAIDNQLLSWREQQATYLADQRRFTLLLDDIQALRNQIEAGAGDAITFADQVTALTLQQQAYIHETPIISPTVGVSQSPAGSLQLQVGPQVDLTTRSRAEQLSLLDNLARTVEARLSGIDVKLLELESRLFDLQRDKQSLANQYDELARRRDVAVETSLTLARKIDEVRVQSQDTGNGLRIASLASPPSKYDRSSLFITAAIAGLAGLLISIGVLLLLTWWKAANERASG